MSSNIPVPHMPNNTAPDADKIDLFELMQTLWQEKLLIILAHFSLCWRCCSLCIHCHTAIQYCHDTKTSIIKPVR